MLTDEFVHIGREFRVGWEVEVACLNGKTGLSEGQGEEANLVEHTTKGLRDNFF